MRLPLLVFLTVFLCPSLSAAQVRKVSLTTDDILTVKTALGIATIIQLPEMIQSAVIGDQSGFKVEYLDRAVTIKPLRSEVKTNLYLITEKRRYNLRLVTLAQALADYIVYVKNQDQLPPPNRWRTIEKSKQLGGIKFSLVKIGHSDNGFILIEAKLTTNSDQNLSIRPGEFEIKQNGSSKVINNLFLSDTRVLKDKPILVGISLAKSDLIQQKPISIELRSQKTLSLTLSEDFLWK